MKIGCRWRDVPSEYGPAKTIYNRYHRWSQRRIWHRIFEKMAASGPVPEELSIDSTHVEAHRSAQGSKGGAWTQAIGTPRGGRTSKIHALADDWLFRCWRSQGRPDGCSLTRPMMPTVCGSGLLRRRSRRDPLLGGAQKAIPTRSQSLPTAKCRRTALLPVQKLAAHRHTLRSPRNQLPIRHRHRCCHNLMGLNEPHPRHCASCPGPVPHQVRCANQYWLKMTATTHSRHLGAFGHHPSCFASILRCGNAHLAT